MNYREWNTKLVEHFFNAEVVGKPAFLQVDPDELAIIMESNDPELARADFTKALQEVVRGDGSFELVERQPDFHIWLLLKTREDVFPLFVGILAASVLAGYDMATEPGAGLSAGAFYPRLEAILNVREIPNEGRNRLRDWWKTLNKWLDDDLGGRRGRSTARPSGPFTIIGYPLSQCTLRKEDRSRLPEFFRWCRLQPGEAVEKDELENDFDAWVHMNRCSLTDRTTFLLHKLFRAGEADAAVADVFSEFERWDGTSRDRQGSRWASIDLQAAVVREHRRLELRFIAKQPPGFPDGSFALVEASGRKQLELRISDPGYYRPFELDVNELRLRAGFELANTRFGLRFSAKKVHLFEQDFSFGEWVSRDQASIGEPCIIIAAAEATTTVEQLLKGGARKGWHPLWQDSGKTGLPPGWRGYCCIEFDRAISAPDGFESLEARTKMDVQFIGGLTFGTGCWMYGALPELAVSTDDEGLVEVEINSKVRVQVERRSRFDLNTLDLPTGEHKIRVGHRTRKIRVQRDAQPDIRQPPLEIGWTFGVDDGPISAPFASRDAPRLGPSLVGAVFNPAALERIKKRQIALYPGHAKVAWLGSEPGQIFWLPERPLIEDIEETALTLSSPKDFVPAWLWWEVQGKAAVTPAMTHPPPTSSPPEKKWKTVSSFKEVRRALAEAGGADLESKQASSNLAYEWAGMIDRAQLVEDCESTTACASSLTYYKQTAQKIVASLGKQL